jgi:hypothetical protein
MRAARGATLEPLVLEGVGFLVLAWTGSPGAPGTALPELEISRRRKGCG